MQGQDFQIDQIVQVAILAVMTNTAYVLDKAFSQKVEISHPVKREDEAELLEKFAQLNPEAQRGAIRYIEKMRKGYQKA